MLQKLPSAAVVIGALRVKDIGSKNTMRLQQKATCMKGLIWPPLEPKTKKVAFHHFLLIGLLED